MGAEGDFVSLIRAIRDEKPAIMALDGVVVAGSWNPTYGTIDVILGDTAAMQLGQPLQTFIPRTGIQLLTPVHGMQAGPVGGERVILVPRQSGWGAILEYWDNDSPGAPSGEFWYVHKNPISGTVDAAFKITNNGIGTDGLGGVQLGGGSYANLTASVLTELGESGLASGNGVVIEMILQTIVNAVISHVQTAMNTLAGEVAGGTGVSPPTISPVTASGSSTVRASA